MKNSNANAGRCFYALILLVLLVAVSPVHSSADKGILFKIEKQGYPVSYVFGTIHFSDPRVLALSEAVNQALESSDAFVMEIKFDKDVLLGAMTGMWLTDGRSLKDVIGADLYQEVLEFGAKAGIPQASFAYMKPWVVMMMFSMPPGDYENILDIELMKKALLQGKQVLGLESFQEQFDVIDKMSDSDQIVLLKNTLKNYSQLTKQFRKLLDIYLDRDLERLQRLADEQTRADSDEEQQVIDRLMARMLDERNVRMLERITKIIQKDSAFIAVGALHLPGQSGLIDGLRQQGFSITAIY